jgi:hypothetical protein
MKKRRGFGWRPKDGIALGANSKCLGALLKYAKPSQWG